MKQLNANIGVLLVAAATTLAVRLFSGKRARVEDDENSDKSVKDVEKAGTPVEPVTLKWHNITCILKNKSGKQVKELLKNASGAAKAGRLLAIMGPSGSGKTTLLNILAGQLPAAPHMKLTGLLYVNGTPCSSANQKWAYIRQEDLFFSQLTVRETLSLAAELQLPYSMSGPAREKYVEELLSRLGLVSCADTRVGDEKVRGISGGERKRLSIACELIASPSVIFADEPTTGLDAFQAEQVMETLRKLAKDGHTIICSIHQPRGSIYFKFDDLMLLSEGTLIYWGRAQDEALTYFDELGYKCPEHVNPAEFFADLISVDFSSPENESSSRKRVASLVATFTKKKGLLAGMDITVYNTTREPSISGKGVTSAAKKHGWLKHFKLLLKRAWWQATRDGPTNKVRSRMSVASAIIFGSIFWRMGLIQSAIQDRMGLLQVAAINTAMSGLIKTVNVFPKERAIVDRERAKGNYSLGPYLGAKLLAEIPVGAAFPLLFGSILYPMARLNPVLSRFGNFASIVTVESFAASAMGLTVGAMVPTTEAAVALGPSLMTVFIVFGGYYVNSGNTPVIFRWIPQVSLIRWAFQALCINEFRGLKFECHNSYDLRTGEQVLERMGFGGSSVRESLTQEGRILLFLYWTTYILLQKNKPRYQELKFSSDFAHSSSDAELLTTVNEALPSTD
ncbi:hypothetical protein O6H91_04G098100 [Diphasiastrum complanatum]|uniref:Uncharacterized protein n=1 Tax=Diphasiastrum complanatum TaxID=34168 RepID=A0ACC2DZN0_DIPCM|nr:hypothetical protein O6H91_04G098100 [Diphasiastrum complanatum]